MFGLLPEIHKPQVWVDRRDAERARRIVDDFETTAAQQRAKVAESPPISVVCEECGRTTDFPASQLGSVESCVHCGAYVDVGDEVGFDDWRGADDGFSD